MVSSDRITTYIGTYTRRESFVDGKAEGIYIYHLDPGSGQLTYGATVAEHRTVIACTTTFMQAQAAYQLYTLTDLASLAPSTRFAAPAAYIGDDAEGLPQLLRVYAAEFAATLTIEGADVAAAIDADTADCFAVDSFDGVITAKNLTILFDVPTAVSRERLERAQNGGRTLDKFEREGASFAERVRAAYLERAGAEPRRFRVVDSTRPQDAVRAELARLVAAA